MSLSVTDNGRVYGLDFLLFDVTLAQQMLQCVQYMLGGLALLVSSFVSNSSLLTAQGVDM